MKCADNIYFQDDRGKFIQLKRMVKRNPKNYHHQLRGYPELLKWIDDCTPLLRNPEYLISTKCFWILNGLTSFPSCVTCGKSYEHMNVSVRNGYKLHCSAACSNRDPATKVKLKHTKLKHYGDPTYTNPEKARETRYKKNNGHWEGISTKTKRMATNVAKYGVQFNFQSDDTKQKAKLTNLDKYGCEYPAQNTAIMKKAQQTKVELYGNKTGRIDKLRRHFSPEIRKKCMNTNLLRYGICNAGASAQAQAKARRKYQYNDVQFDSSPELAYYIWLTDSKINFMYHPSIFFEYQADGCCHRYYPDFYLVDENMFVEIKGDHFFDKLGRLKNPYRKSTMNRTKTRHMLDAKLKCMKDNNVIIMRNLDYQKYIDYVIQKYGRDFLARCKNKI